MKVQKSPFPFFYFSSNIKKRKSKSEGMGQEILEEEVKKRIFPISKNTAKKSCMIYVVPM